MNIQGRRTPFKSPSGSFEWNPRLSCITTEIKYVNRCVLCLEMSQVCTSLFYLHWNVRKILLVSFISLHERLLLFQLGIIRKNCKYNCLSHLEKKKRKKGGAKRKSSSGNTNLSHRQSKTRLAGTVQLRFYGCNDLSEWKQSNPTIRCSQDWPTVFPVTKTFFLFHFPISFCLHATEVIPSATRDLSTGRMKRQTWSQAQLHCCVPHCFTQTLRC